MWDSDREHWIVMMTTMEKSDRENGGDQEGRKERREKKKQKGKI